MAFQFKLPDLGEGLTEGEIVKWRVKEGDSVKEDQILVEVLTDKATVEIPSPKAGRVLKLSGKAGDLVQVGQVVVEIETGAPAAPSAPAAPARAAAPDNGSRPAMAAAPPPAGGDRALATPAVRKEAEKLGVDLGSVKGTGPGGRVTSEDVRAASKGAVATAPAPAGREERVPLRGIRRVTAEKMAQSHRIIPQVTHMEELDASALVALREEKKAEAEKRGVKLTYLAFIVKAAVKALKEFPGLNASVDDEKREIVLKRYYNVGIAVDSEHGLFKPVIKDADKKDVWTLAKEIADLADKARRNALSTAELSDGTFTLTNVGPIGGVFATPMVTHPETAILGVMKLAKKPVVKDGKVAVGDVLTLALSFDHRAADGAEAGRFTNTLIAALENPRTLL